ncbi:hypothetical protein P879_03685 [Paragonimus westermani]|uniref:Uncharacterized protein n=1 Tax=Paragonimus westermani TaxID=34504 RepID=A0A8T0DUF3_9TREM|nr:hypothetical protein P879_03685 [Paragonimus westermani]
MSTTPHPSAFSEERLADPVTEVMGVQSAYPTIPCSYSSTPEFHRENVFTKQNPTPYVGESNPDFTSKDVNTANKRLNMLQHQLHVQQVDLEQSYRTCNDLQERIQSLMYKVSEREEVLSRLSTETNKLKCRYEQLFLEVS